MLSSSVNTRKPISTRLQEARRSAALAVTFTVLAALSSVAVAGGIYKSIDSQGNIVFSDQPSENAEALNSEAIREQARSLQSEESTSSDNEEDDSEEDDDKNGNVKPATTVLAAPEPVNPPKPEATANEEAAQHLPITQVKILTPEHNTRVKDPLGQIWVEVQSYPTSIAKSGLIAQLWMDERLITSDKSTMLRLPPPASGTHVLRVKLVDQNGQLFHESNAVHIHVWYQSAER